MIGIPLLLIVKQPDTSTSIAIALIFISLLFIAGLSYKIVLTVLGICIPTGLIGITVILRMAQSSGDYRFGRIMAWLYPQDTDGRISQHSSKIRLWQLDQASYGERSEQFRGHIHEKCELYH